MLTLKALEETSKVLGEAINGDFIARGRIKQLVDQGHVLNESISSSDLARTFSFTTNASLQAQYAKVDFTWTKFAKRDVFEDFKPKRKKELIFNEDQALAENGGHVTAPGSLPVVPEQTEYPTFNWTTSGNELALYKTGARVGFGWEAVINDEWELIRSLPSQLLVYATNTEETEAVKVLASTTGPNPDTFKGVAAPSTAPLSLASLKAAKTEIRYRQVNGNYVTVSKFALVVPTTLRDYAEELLKITEIERVEGAGTSTEVRTKSQTGNSDVTLVVNDWLTKVDKSANRDTTWYLVPIGGNDGTRDSIVVNFLRNHEKPELTQSTTGHSYVGGGEVPTLEGSLRNDTSEYRVRHVVTGGYWHNHALFASTGSGA